MFYDDHLPLFPILDIPSHPLVPDNMPFIAPLILAVLVHVIVFLWTVVVSILSAWKKHRVELASAAFPSHDDVPPVIQPRSYFDHKVAQSPPPSPRSVSRFSAVDSDSESDCQPLYFKATTAYHLTKQAHPIPFKRSLSSQSPVDLGLIFEKSRSKSFPPSSPASAPPASLPPSPGMPAFLCLNEGSDFGDDDEVNSVTGSLKEDPRAGLRNVHARHSITSAAEIAQAERAQGRRILCFLSVLRACVVGPLVWFELVMNDVTLVRCFKTGLDLVILDLVLSTILALCPLFYFLTRWRLSLPATFEHHVYYTSLIMLVLPLLSTLQLPDVLAQPLALPLYRMAAPVISAIVLLVSREVANQDFWAPMERKKRSKWAY